MTDLSNISLFLARASSNYETLNTSVISVIVNVGSGSVHCGVVKMTALPSIERCSNISKWSFAFVGLSTEIVHLAFKRRYHEGGRDEAMPWSAWVGSMPWGLRKHKLNICRATRNEGCTGTRRGAISSIQHNDFKSITSSVSCRRNKLNNSWDLTSSPDICCFRLGILYENARKKRNLIQRSTQAQTARGVPVAVPSSIYRTPSLQKWGTKNWSR